MREAEPLLTRTFFRYAALFLGMLILSFVVLFMAQQFSNPDSAGLSENHYSDCIMSSGEAC